jgi:hypothetical protein
MRTDAGQPRVEPSAHHHLGVYDTEQFLVATIVEAIVQAIADEVTGVAIVPARHHEPIRRGLLEHDLDVTDALETGAYIQADADELVSPLMQEGERAAEVAGGSFERLLREASGRGREPRVYADLFSPPWRLGRHRQVLDVERWLNTHLSGTTFSLLCLYDSAVFRDGDGDDPFISLCEQHALVAPVEDHVSLVEPTDERAVALLEQQHRAHRLDHRRLDERRRIVAVALERCIVEASEQREHFERALISRDVIGQAKGIIMVRWRLDADEAFEMLLDASNRSGRKLHDVAEAVVEQQRRLS